MRDAALGNVVAFPHGGRFLPPQHDHKDPLSRKNLDHAYIAMHVAAQYDEDHIDGFMRELIADGRAGDIADVLDNNTRAMRYLMSAIDFMMEADTAISKAADRLLAAVDGGAHVGA